MRDALLAQLATELRRLTTHVADLHFLDLTGRLAARLVRIAEEDGLRADDGSYRLETRITQGDLASMIGATRQSVNKLLGEFEDLDLVRLEPDAIIIPDLRRLLERARR
jgi:CRP-like cAMP-binding protein